MEPQLSSPLRSTDAPRSRWYAFGEVVLLTLLFFLYAGDPPPMVNEAHYLVKAKNFWQPDWCQADLFASSGKAHTTFYALFGWPTLFFSLDVVAWIGRWAGWLMLAIGLQRLCSKLLPAPMASLGVATLWIAGIEYGNLAGEWVVGGIEAKVPAYGFILLALAAMADRKWNRVWPLLGAAAAFHVLSGGWAVLTAMVTWIRTEWSRADRVPLFSVPLFVGGAISLFGLIPALWLTIGGNPEDATAAARIYAYFRIKHHLLPVDFLPLWYFRHGLLIAAVLAIGKVGVESDKWKRMRAFTYGAIGIAAVGMLVGLLPSVMPDLAARLLRFYWFRLTDAVVPLMVALSLLRVITDDDAPRRRLRIGVGISALLIASLLVLHSGYQRLQIGVPPSASNRLLGWDTDATEQEQEQVFHDWRKVCRWAKESTDASEVFLTPRHQQSFKWYAERAEVVNWKDVPQDSTSLREWYRRFRDVFPRRLGTLRVTIRYGDLRRIGSEYGVRYLIVDRRIAGENLPLVKVYPSRVEDNPTFAVYRLPPQQ